MALGGSMSRHTTVRHIHVRLIAERLGGLRWKCGKEAKDEVSGLTQYNQVLAIDLLNPTPQAEARKHKLKVRHR